LERGVTSLPKERKIKWGGGKVMSASRKNAVTRVPLRPVYLSRGEGRKELRFCPWGHFWGSPSWGGQGLHKTFVFERKRFQLHAGGRGRALIPFVKRDRHSHSFITQNAETRTKNETKAKLGRKNPIRLKKKIPREKRSTEKSRIGLSTPPAKK